MRVCGVSTVAGSYSCTVMLLAVVLVVKDVVFEPSNTNCIGSSYSSASSLMTADMGTMLSASSSDECPLSFVDCCRCEDASPCIGSTTERGIPS